MRYRPAITLAAGGAAAAALPWYAARRRSVASRPIHVAETEQTFLSAGTRVVILGAGFGGLAAALTLDRLLAWPGWHAYYLYRIPTSKRRIELVSAWIVAAMFGREMAQLRVGRVEVRS